MASIGQVSLALSDPIRLRILDRLAAGRFAECCSPEHPETPHGLTASDILLGLGIAATKLSYHMKELREAGLVHEQKSGRWVYYSLNRTTIEDYMRALQDRLMAAI